MMGPMRRLASISFAAGLLLPVASEAQDQLLVQRDFDSLTESEQWMSNDAWCIAAIDLAMDAPGYNRDKLTEARQVTVDEFIGGEGGTQAELDANVAYTTDYYRNSLQNGTVSLDQILDGCVGDPKL